MLSSSSTKPSYENHLKEWLQSEKQAVAFIQAVSTLWFEHSIEVVLFRHQLVDKSVSEILSLHHQIQQTFSKDITIQLTTEIVTQMLSLTIAPARIDIGRLATEYINQKESSSVNEFISQQLTTFIGEDKRVLVPKDVVLYGFGRIGRLAARELITQTGKGEQLRLRAIVTRGNSDNEISKRAALLRTDSVHGSFAGTIIEDLENKCLILNGQVVHMLSANSPDAIDYESYGIHNALIIDNTGASRDRDGLEKHLQAKGATQVLLTAPGKGNIPNVVYGVNHEQFDGKNEKIVSAASCTTNAIVPILAVIKEKLGIVAGHIETIHSYTNDQNLLDNYHSKYRRGRSAALNMVITETGAAKAVTKIFPELIGKLTANAVRVPTPNVSLAILKMQVEKQVTKEEVNSLLKKAALEGDLVEQIQYAISNELVSSDLVGNPCASIYDSQATLVGDDGKNIVLYVWYDNEYGYTRQVIRYAKHIADVRRLMYY